MKNSTRSNNNSIVVITLFLFFLLYNGLNASGIKDGKDVSVKKAEQFLSENKEFGFQENKGQIMSSEGSPASYVLFKANAPGLNIWITNTGITYQFLKFEEEGEKEKEKEREEEGEDEKRELDWRRVDMVLKNATIKKENIRVEDEIEKGKINYFLSSCPQGVFDVKTFKKITIANVYPGIDWVIYTINDFNNSFLKQDFIVHPNADPNQIKIVYEGNGKFNAVNNQIAFENELGKIAEGELLCYQNNKSNSIGSNYIITKNDYYQNLGAGNFANHQNAAPITVKTNKSFSYEVSIQLSNYDKNQDLIIDPELYWSTFYGGTDLYEAVLAMECNQTTGDLVVTGYAGSTNFPVINVAGAYNQSTHAGIKDVYVAKFTNNGVPIWLTYYGGSDTEQPWALSIDQSSNIVITGETESSDFPLQNPGGGAYFQAANTNNSQDAYILKFDANGARIWCTYFGGNNSESAYGITTDNSGNIFIVGESNSTNIPLLNPGGGTYYQTNNSLGGFNEAFISKFNGAGVLQWSTYYGGASNEIAYAVTADANGNIFMTGYTSSFGSAGTFPLLNPGGGAFYDATMTGNADAFIVKFDNNGVQKWSTLFGGNSSIDKGFSIKCDKVSDVIVTGLTGSLTNFPVFNPGNGAYYQANNGNASGSIDAFILKFDNNGVQKWGTYYGGSGQEKMNTYDNIAIDTCNNLFISFNTESTDVPTLNSVTNCASAYFDGTANGAEDIFISKFDEIGKHSWASYLGGDGSDWREALAIDFAGSLYVGGEWTEQGGVTLNSSTYMLVNPGGGAYYDPSFDGGTTDDAYIVKLKTINLTLQTTATNSNGCNGCNGSATVTINCGEPTFNYVWSNGSQTFNSASNTNTITGLCPGTYTVTVTSGCNVILTATTTVGGSNGTIPTITTGGPLSISCTNTTGTISANATPSNVNYSWTGPGVVSGGNTNTATVNAAGTYTVTVTDQGGCSNTATVQVTSSTMPTVAITSTNIICNGTNNGTATATVTGGVTPYSYSWSTTPVQTNATANNLAAGTYTCIVTDASGCSSSNSVTITQAAALTSSSNVLNNVTCNTLCNGSAAVTVNGGTPNYTYSWNTTPVQTGTTANNLCAGSYICTITDANRCTFTTSITITQPAVLLTTNFSGTKLICNGTNNGSATVVPTGGTPAYTYLWNTNPAQTSDTVNNLSAGTYAVTVTDANGCTSSNSVTINQPTPVVASITNSTNVACNGQCNGSATVAANGGTPNYTYSWNTIPAQTGATANNLCAGSYTVTVTDVNGCTATAVATIAQQSTITANINSTNALCNGAANGTATITANGGTPNYFYSWSTTPIQTNATANNLAAGTYTCTVTDANGCTATATVTITQPNVLNSSISSSSNATCNANCNGTATVTAIGGTPNYSYSWNTSPAQTSATTNNLCAGSYIVTVTDANGCTSTNSVTITAPTAISTNINSTNVTCNAGANGSATVTANGGTPNYSYSWNTTPVQTTATASNLTAGSYTVIVTDANGCTTTNTVTITEPSALVANVSATTNVTCNGLCNGSATVTTTGGNPNYTYSWNTIPVQTGATANNLCAGSYTVTVTDVNGCTATAVATITQQSTITANINSTNALCNGAANGTAIITANGGTPNYFYSWSTTPVQTNATANNLAAGSYTCTVTDANGCTATASVTISQPNILNSNITSSSNATCNTNCNGTATVTAVGGTPNYSYSWNTTPVQTGTTASNLCAGSYVVMVTDINGCTSTNSVTITAPTTISTTINSTNITCNAGANGNATIIANGGTPNYSYSWSTTPVQTTAMASNLTAGSYTVIVTDANGCTTTNTVTITEPSALVANIVTTTNITCNGFCNGSATVTANGSTPGYTYLWNTVPAQTTTTATNLCPGIYSVIVTDINGCTTSVTTGLITEPAALTNNSMVSNVTCNAANNGSATVNTAGGTPAYSYVWSTIPVQTTATATNLGAGTYTCIVTDANGCTNTTTITITQPNALNINISSSAVKCYGQCTGIANASVNGGSGNYNYSWSTSPVQTNATASNLCAGTYSVTITDNNGCTTTASVTINQPSMALNSALVASTNAKCNGSANGSLTVQTNGGTPAYSYSWSTTPVQTSATATNLAAGNYTVTVTDNNGCSTTNSYTITQPSGIIIDIENITQLCDDVNSVSIDVSGGSMPYTYFWNTTPAQYSSSISNIGSGAYTVIVTDANGCTQSTTVTINNTYVTPTPGFSVDPTSALLYSNTLFTFTDNSSNGNTWVWDFGDGFTSSLQNPTHTYTDTGDYCITQTVINMPSGCKADYTYCVRVEADWTFYVPNAFTPDNDGTNDYFSGKGTGIKKYKMIVFDRWGDEIFVTDNIDIGWDGRANKGDDIAQQDVYVYKIILTDIKDKEHQYIGHFTLVK